MQFSVWSYPWDLLDEDIESVADRLTDIGIDEVNLATNYHSVQPFLPHNSERKTFFARASSYFHPDESHYGRLSPIPNRQMGDADWLGMMDDALADTDIALESPYGDSLAFGLCPSQPEVQEFLCGLLADLSERACFKRIGLETFDYFYGTGFGWHHDKYHVELGKLGEFLFGLCFCEECRDHATNRGINVEQARTSAQAGIDGIIHGELSPETSPAGWLRSHPELSAYVDVRTETLSDLYGSLRSTVGGDVELGRYAGFFEIEDEWMHGADLNSLATHLDYYTVIAYESTRREIVQRVRAADQLTPDVPLHVGILPGPPAINDPGTVTDAVNGLADDGVERVSFYNYGLLPERNLDWIATATEPY
jgi:hypothetical protein